MGAGGLGAVKLFATLHDGRFYGSAVALVGMERHGATVVREAGKRGKGVPGNETPRRSGVPSVPIGTDRYWLVTSTA